VPYAGYQKLTIPKSGSYTIVAQGGQGGASSYAGGYGCKLTASFTLNGGDILWIGVGHAGASGHTQSNDWCSAGGGGATFVAVGSSISTSTILICAAGGIGARENRFGDGTAGASSSANGTSGAGFTSFKSVSINGSYGGYANYFSYGGFGGGTASDDSYGPAGSYDAMYSLSPNSYVDASGTSVSRANQGDNRWPSAGYVTVAKAGTVVIPTVLYVMTTFTFSSPITAGSYTNGAAPTRVEMFGPSTAELQTYYNSNNSTLASMLSAGTYFSVPYAGYQKLTIPQTGTYTIIAQGGHGGVSSYAGGYGCKLTASFTLNGGDILWIAVGHSGANGHTTASDWCSAGGGGATFVAVGPNVSTSTILLCAAGGIGARENRIGDGTAGVSSSANGTSGAGFTSFKAVTINGSYGGYANYFSYGGFGGGSASDDTYGPAGSYDGMYSFSPNSYVDSSGTSVSRANQGDYRWPNAGYVTITKN
jgi:hypothetical protein